MDFTMTDIKYIGCALSCVGNTLSQPTPSFEYIVQYSISFLPFEVSDTLSGTGQWWFLILLLLVISWGTHEYISQDGQR